MKIAHVDESPQESYGIQKSKIFQIRTSAHAFKMLSSGLYSDKISAVLREIGCNAHDAHVEAHQTKPFEVKIPTKLDNQFYIKDWGVGLDDTEVEDMYTTYFGSTKQNSNDYTGAFGLGSKSPFSYTDSYTMVAVKNGTKRVYTAHLDEQGSPTISLLHTGPADADWQSGVMVGFPVRPDDFEKFALKADRIFRFFNPCPTIIGAKKPTPLTFTEDNGSYAFMTPESCNLMSGSMYYRKPNFLQMGNVVYPLATSNLSFKNPNNLDVYISAASDISGVLVRVPIGAVQIAASREEIQYDDATKETIAKILCEIPKATIKKLVAEERTIKTWEQLCDYKDRLHQIGRSMSITEDMLEKTGCTKDEAKRIRGYMVYSKGVQWMQWDATAKKAKIQHMTKSGSRDFKAAISTPLPSSARYFYPNTSAVIIRGDDKNPYARARLAIKTGKYTDVIVVSPFDGGDITNVDGAIKELQKIVLDMPVVDSSTLDKPVKTKAAAARLNEQVVLDGTDVLLNDVPDDRKIYIQVKRRSAWGRQAATYFIHGNETSKWTLQNIDRNLKSCSLFLQLPSWPIELNKTLIKRYKLESDTEWEEYSTHIKKMLESNATYKALIKFVGGVKPIIDFDYHSSVDNIVSSMAILKHKLPKSYAALVPTLKAHGLLDDIETLHANSLIARNYKAAVSKYDVDRALDAYKQLCSMFDAKVKSLPTTQSAAVLKKFSNASKLEFELLVDLAKVSDDLLIAVVDHQLKKG